VQEAQQTQHALYEKGFLFIKIATSYEDGFEHLQSDRIDLFIIDWNTGEYGGLRLIQALRSSKTYSQTPMLVSTERQDVEDMLEAMKAGANDLIHKPFTRDLLGRKVSFHVQRNRPN
jgi:two-component system chemotaxis response regulator CheY